MGSSKRYNRLPHDSAPHFQSLLGISVGRIFEENKAVKKGTPKKPLRLTLRDGSDNGLRLSSFLQPRLQVSFLPCFRMFRNDQRIRLASDAFMNGLQRHRVPVVPKLAVGVLAALFAGFV